MGNSISKTPEIIKPKPGQESVWDYPRPPRVEDTPKKIKVVFNDVVIAETTRAKRVLETAGAPVYYLPPEDVKQEYLTHEENKSTFCEWKGRAAYYSLEVDGNIARNAAWQYLKPTPNYQEIKGYFAFYAGKMDACYVDEEKALPQPGEYYGGWVTNDIVGPIKGEPGSEFW